MIKLPNQAGGLSYSVVIATCDREESLAFVLGDWAGQTVRPERVVVVRAKPADEETKRLKDDRPEERGGQPKAVEDRRLKMEDRIPDLRSTISDLPLVELNADERSAAKQRNLGAEEVETEWIVFCDDDVRFGPDLAERTAGFLHQHSEAVAVSPRMRGAGHPLPGRWLRKYYGMQAGFDDETYGAKLFGAGLSCYPCWERQPSPVETNWLPSTMLWMQTDLFKRHKFPDFEGYSFGEDAHLTHRVWREATQSGGKMFFLAEPDFEHLSIQSGVKANRFHLGKMTVRNQKQIAREAMGKSPCEIFWKSLLHRGFVTIALLKSRRRGWVGEMAGIWRG